MKKLILPLLAALLLLVGCVKVPPPADPVPLPEAWAPFAYDLDFRVGLSHETHAEDGTLVCACHYEVPELLPSGELTEKQQASLDAFRAAMEELLADSRYTYETLSSMALENYSSAQSDGLDWFGHYMSETTCTAWCGERAVSLQFQHYINSGGAHPSIVHVCHLFDLEQGEMVEIREITSGTGDAFFTAVSNEILRQIDEQGLAEFYYEDYADAVNAHTDAQYYFHDGTLTVLFPLYTLAPYAAGFPIFEIPAEIYAAALNTRGQALLGLS